MERTLVLEAKIRVYSEDHKHELDEDFMTLADWDVIRKLKQNLEPFWELTIDLQSQARRRYTRRQWLLGINSS